jgi:soluble lytic murein transglycosylase-like protein
MVIKTMWRKTITALTLAAFLSGGALASRAASVSQLENQHALLRQQIAGERSTLAGTAAQAQDVQARLNAVDASLVTTGSRLARTGALEMQSANDLVQGEARLARLKADMAGERRQVGAVLKFIQEEGPGSYLSVLMGAQSFSDFLGRMVYLRSLVSYQVGVLKKFHGQETREAAQVRSLRQQVSSLAAMARTARAAEIEYQAQAGQRKTLLAQLDSQRSVEAAMVSRLEQQDSALMQAIHQLEAAAKNLPPGQIGSIVTAMAEQYGVDPALIWDIIRQESGGNANATSRAGAEGLMQLMPGTAAELGVTDPYDPKQNIRGGVAYFAQLLKQFNGNVALALAAYNAGPGAVRNYGGIPPYQETQNYVKKILGEYQKSASAGPG